MNIANPPLIKNRFSSQMRASHVRCRMSFVMLASLSLVMSLASSESWAQFNTVGKDFALWTGETSSSLVERVRITKVGLSGFGIVNPSHTVDVSGTVRATRFLGDGSGLTNLSVTTISGTTTMVSGWPDALTCRVTAGSGTGSNRVMELEFGSSTGVAAYRWFNVDSYTVLDFNANKTFNQLRQSGGSGTATDCDGKSISQLYAEGKAFNYIGNSGIGGGALGDRLTSGTLGMIANAANSVISLTTNGTTWGYLGSNFSYLPIINTSAISATVVQISSNTAVSCGAGNAGTLRYNNTNTSLELCTGSGWQMMGVGIPAGTISAFSSTTCPTGWSEYTPARGRFLRGIDNGAGNDTEGTRTPGAVQADEFRTHAHNSANGAYFLTSGNGSAGVQSGAGFQQTGATTSVGGAETRPKNVAVTYCQFNGTSNGWNSPLSGGGTVPGGTTTQIQYNTSGSFDGNAGLTWTNASQRLTATYISSTALSAGAISATNISVTTINGMPVNALSGNSSPTIVSGTTTMDANWPDALRCTVNDSGWGKVTLAHIITVAADASHRYRFMYSTSSVSQYDLAFNADGTFNSRINIPASTDCDNKSISTLYAEGKAFNFIGNSGVSDGALGDRLISGSFSLTANTATNRANLITSGTTWGYFGSNGSYLPNLVSANVSASSISTTVLQIASSATTTCGGSNAGTLRFNSINTSLELCTGTGWQVMGVGIPAGTISAFASTTCPTGWSEYTPARGRFLRGIDNGAGNDASGNRAPGAVQADLISSHNHPFTDGADWRVNGGTGSTFGLPETGQNYVGTTNRAGVVGYSGGAETRPKNVAVTFCQFNGTSNGWNNPLSGGSTVPGGSTGQIQYNTSGSFDGNAGLTWTNANQRLTATNISTSALTVNGIPITGNSSGDRIVSGTASLTVDTAGTVTQRSSGNSKLALQGDGANFIELGNTRTTNNYAYIDLIGDATYTDYGLRLIRDNAGPNANSWLQHRGTGGLHLMTQEAAPIVFRTSNTEQMRVLPNGNVGIGTSLPQAPMEVAGITTARAIAQGSVGLGHISETGWDGNGIIFTNSYETSAVTHRSIVQNGGKLHFGRHSSSGHATDIFIAETGNIGIGTNSPRTSLDSPRGAVFDQVSVGACPFGSCIGENNIGYSYESIQLPGGTNLRLFFGSNQRFIFGNDGTPYKPNGGSWAALSDKRLKQVNGNYTLGLNQIVALNPVRYHYAKNNVFQQPSDKEYVGLLAQDVEPHFPEAVHKAEDGYYRLDTTSINFAMINAVKELKAENDDLKTELRRLRQDFEVYKHRRSQVVELK